MGISAVIVFQIGTSVVDIEIIVRIYIYNNTFFALRMEICVKTPEPDTSTARPRARLSTTTGVALYRQVQEILRFQIFNGALAPGDRMPTEQEVCEDFGVSRITARRALNELAKLGLVTRARGRGTRVVEHPPRPAMRSSIEGWLESASIMGRSTTAQVLDLSYVPARADVAAALGLPAGSIFQRAVRLRHAENEPISYLVTYVPEDLGRQFSRADLERKPLLHLLEAIGVTVAGADQSISATVAGPEVAAALSILAGAPLLDVRRIVRDVDARPVEYIRVLYRPEIHQISMSMRRIPGLHGMTWSPGDSPLLFPGEDQSQEIANAV